MNRITTCNKRRKITNDAMSKSTYAQVSKDESFANDKNLANTDSNYKYHKHNLKGNIVIGEIQIYWPLMI